MKNLPKILIFVIVGILILAGAFYAFKKSNIPLTKPSAGNFDWKIVQVTDKVSAPNYELDVYLSGEKASEVQAAEVDASLDNTNVMVTDAESGGFYTSPLVVKMDKDNLVFALARNPGNNSSIDTTKPLVKLQLRSKTGFNQTLFSILPTSQIYVKNIGGANPTVSQFTLQK